MDKTLIDLLALRKSLVARKYKMTVKAFNENMPLEIKRMTYSGVVTTAVSKIMLTCFDEFISDIDKVIEKAMHNYDQK